MAGPSRIEHEQAIYHVAAGASAAATRCRIVSETRCCGRSGAGAIPIRRRDAVENGRAAQSLDGRDDGSGTESARHGRGPDRGSEGNHSH